MINSTRENIQSFYDYKETHHFFRIFWHQKVSAYLCAARTSAWNHELLISVPKRAKEQENREEYEERSGGCE